MPAISVLIATYNRKEFLTKCLDSLTKQTFRDFETVLVDDGSDDGTHTLKNRVDKYELQKHRGISLARNKLLDNVKGKYFFIMDDDDKLHPDCLKNHYDIAQETGADLVFSYYEYFGHGVKEETVQEYYPQDFNKCYEIKRIPHAALYRTETLGHFRYDPSLQSAVDYDYILNILAEYPEIKMTVIRKPLYKYRCGHKQERGTAAQNISVGIIRNKHRHRYGL